MKSAMTIINEIINANEMYSDFRISRMLEERIINPEQAVIFALQTRMNPSTGYRIQYIFELNQKLGVVSEFEFNKVIFDFMQRNILHCCADDWYSIGASINCNLCLEKNSLDIAIHQGSVFQHCHKSQPVTHFPF